MMIVVYWRNLGGNFFPRSNRGSSDFGSLNLNHPEKRMLKNYKIYGAPVKLRTKPWTLVRLRRALCRGPHKLTYEYLDFLQEESKEIIHKGQWVILSYDKVKGLPGLCIPPPRVVSPNGTGGPGRFATTLSPV